MNESEAGKDKAHHHEDDKGYVNVCGAALGRSGSLMDYDKCHKGSDDAADLADEVLYRNEFALLTLGCVGPLNETRCRPKHGGREAQDGAAENREPFIACTIIVEEAGYVKGIACNAKGHRDAWPDPVEDGAREETEDGENAVKQTVGDVAHPLRRWFAAAGPKPENGKVDADGEE